MKARITHAGDFAREVEVEAIPGQPGSYRVQFNSQLASAKNPKEWQRNLALILQKSELVALKNLIEASL